MARVLLYNLREENRRKKVKALLFQLAIPSREVQLAEQDHPLGYLLGLPDYAPAGAGEEAPFSEEMLVMHALSPRQFNGLLDGMKRAGIRLPLKAVVTPQNIAWSSRRLRQELRAEHEAMTAREKQTVSGTEIQ